MMRYSALFQLRNRFVLNGLVPRCGKGIQALEYRALSTNSISIADAMSRIRTDCVVEGLRDGSNDFPSFGLNGEYSTAHVTVMPGNFSALTPKRNI